MSDFKRKSSMENYGSEIALKVARRNDTKETRKAILKDFDIPFESWEQSTQERSKWRGLINKGAALYERKRIWEAEIKHREWATS